jgi:hypothetical protein
MTRTTQLSPEVDRFVNRVRAEFIDLSPEEREELLGDLNADVTDLVAEHGFAALGDPVAYAAELRAAAGLGPGVTVTDRGMRRHLLEEWLDQNRDSLLGRLNTGVWAGPWLVVLALRPVWWVIRAWLAWWLVLENFTSGTIELLSFSFLSFPIVGLLVAVVLSVLIGLQKMWPGGGGIGARVLLIGLNTFAGLLFLLLVMGAALRAPHVSDGGASSVPVSRAGLQNGGNTVCNIFAYNQVGKPVRGVQLFDQRGEPLAINPRTCGVSATGGKFSPWQYPSGKPALNIFPIGVRGFDSTGWPVPQLREPGPYRNLQSPVSPSSEGADSGEPNSR